LSYNNKLGGQCAPDGTATRP